MTSGENEYSDAEWMLDIIERYVMENYKPSPFKDVRFDDYCTIRREILSLMKDDEPKTLMCWAEGCAEDAVVRCSVCHSVYCADAIHYCDCTSQDAPKWIQLA